MRKLVARCSFDVQVVVRTVLYDVNVEIDYFMCLLQHDASTSSNFQLSRFRFTPEFRAIHGLSIGIFVFSYLIIILFVDFSSFVLSNLHFHNFQLFSKFHDVERHF